MSHEVLSALAHELGGIASALDLRAAAMAPSIPERDLAALREIAEQVRMATKAARLARGSDTSGMLNPMRRQSLADWWKLTSRFTSAVLPRGVSVEAQFSTDQMASGQASTVTWIWLAACKEMAERGLLTPVRLSVIGGSPDKDFLELKATLDARKLTLTEKYRSRWSRHAARLAKAMGSASPTWKRNGSTVTWSFVFKA
ncbi:MAG TPA: hypothetical protein VFZ73_08420 [Gemmatimonadaceae bacterium]